MRVPEAQNRSKVIPQELRRSTERGMVVAVSGAKSCTCLRDS
jgi:hypothetical protein